MVVSKSKYDSLQRIYLDLLKSKLAWENAYNSLNNKWSELVDRINAKGGESFLDGESSEFTDQEIKNLIRLCHPDKHDQSSMSKELTQKLLKMRDSK